MATERDRLAYVVVSPDGLGPYDKGQTFPATELHEEEARDLIKQGVIAEVGPGEKPKAVAREAAKAVRDEAKGD